VQKVKRRRRRRRKRTKRESEDLRERDTAQHIEQVKLI